MEEEKVKVAILGNDSNLLKNVVERINKSRPAEVVYFLSLKDFLEHCLENLPDFIGVSVSYPHKSAARFPKVFKMALNVPVLVFGENQDTKTRKLLSSAQGDLKISGVITAHNLWMKIVNFKKMQEQGNRPSHQKNSLGSSSIEVKSNTTHLKGNPTAQQIQTKNSLLSNLFAALDDSENNEEKQSNMQMIQSSNVTKFKKEHSPYVSSDGLDSENKSTTNNMNHITSTEGSIKATSNSGFVQGVGSEEGSSIESNMSEGANIISGSKSNNMSSFPEEQSNNHSNSSNDSSSSNGFFDPTTGSSKNKKKNNLHDFPDKMSSQPQVEERKQKQPEFGKVQLSDEKEMQKEKFKKDQAREEKNFQKKKDLLISACEYGLRKAFQSKPKDAPESFSTEKMIAFILESGQFQGYVVLAESRQTKGDGFSKEFRTAVLESLKEGGVHCEISQPHWISIGVENYQDSVKEFSEFSLNYSDENGFQQNVSFVEREVVRPSFQDSDKEDMYNVDIKVIPPKTPVNFDAYLYLPRNKRFVRYLKEGRSLSLKQAKRHSEESDQSKLYLPKNQKDLFISFYIQNTLNWEFTLHKTKKAS